MFQSQVEPYSGCPIERASLCLPTGLPVSGPVTEISSFYWVHLSRFYLKTETESSLRNVVLNKGQDDRYVEDCVSYLRLSFNNEVEKMWKKMFLS
jgi:hypothetical protein